MSWSKKLLVKLRVLVTFSILGMPALAQAQRVPCDIGNNGVSDLVLINVDAEKKLHWSAFLTPQSHVYDLGQLGVVGDHIIFQDWIGEGVPQKGVISVNDKNKIEWKIVSRQGVALTETFGVGGQTVVSGANFNNSNFADGAVVFESGRRLVWRIASDMFTNNVQVVNRINFGLKGDRPFFANIDGSGDWMGVARRVKKNVGRLIFKNPRGKRKKVYRIRGRMANQIKGNTPFAVQQPDGKDMIVVANRLRSKTVLFFQAAGRAKVVRKVLEGSGDIVVGNFSGEAGDEVVLQRANGQYLIFNPFSAGQSVIQAPGGILIDEININKMSAVKTAPKVPNTPSNPGNYRCERFPGSFIYKTIGSSHFNDVRRNTMGLILRRGASGPFPFCIEVKDTKGNLIAKMGAFTPPGSEWAARYYAGWGCGVSTPLSGASAGSRAKSNTGSTQVIFDFGTKCYGSVDATRCIGSSQC